jgi:hypothetical protein
MSLKTICEDVQLHICQYLNYKMRGNMAKSCKVMRNLQPKDYFLKGVKLVYLTRVFKEWTYVANPRRWKKRGSATNSWGGNRRSYAHGEREILQF